jgi:diguanylate cyclase (GGDEF)-like protein/putative nucleotidyltransferase with HDIG domain
MRTRPWAALLTALVDGIDDTGVRWRVMAALYLTAAPLAGVTLLMPHGHGTTDWAIGALAASATLVGVVLLVLAERLPRGGMGALLGIGTVMISLALLAGGDTGSPYALLYVWAGVEGFFFLRVRGALLLNALIAGCYGAVLLALPSDGSAPARWLLSVGAVVVSSALAGVLQARAERLVTEMAAMARTDALTGLLNRRGFAEVIDHELERARRGGHGVSIVVGDLDHFKALNDRHGHGAGDLALQAFGRLCAAHGRRIDAAARIGGEEFALILPHTDEHGAFLVAERLRRAQRDQPPRPDAPLSVSFGVATFPRHGAVGDALLHAADQALYAAKELGRDRSVIFSPEVASSLRAGARATAGGREHVAAVLVLAETLDLRDSGTALHSRTVGRYAELVAEEVGLGPERVDRIRLAGLLHDVGKLGVPDHVLRKPGRLDPEEWAEIRKHPELGARILAGANLDDIAGWVLAHHERPDRGGYPFGLPGNEIPLEARILAVADAYEAMTADRVYRSALGHEAAMAELRAGGGRQFDGAVVEALLAALDRPAAFLNAVGSMSEGSATR